MQVPKTRRVLLRIGFVLGRDGGALPVLAKLTRWFLGGAAGSGRQYISWIHIADLNRMFMEGIERENLAGTYNAAAPNPVTNTEFMARVAACAAPAVVSAGAGMGGASRLTADENRTVTGADRTPLFAETVSGKRF